MKKKAFGSVIVLVSALIFTVLSFSGCGLKETSLELGKTAVVENYVEFTPENVIISKTIFPPMPYDNPEGGWMAGEGNINVVLVAKVKNLTDKAMATDNFCEFYIADQVDWHYGDVYSLAENERHFNEEEKIESGETKTVCLFVEMNQKNLEYRPEPYIALGFFEEANDREALEYNYKLPFDPKKSVAAYKELKTGQKITLKNGYELTLRNVESMRKLEPTNTADFYEYWVPHDEEKERLLVMEMELENSHGKELPAKGLFGVSLVRPDRDSFMGQSIVENENGNIIAEETAIGKGESRTGYGIVGIPKQAADEKLEVFLYIDGDYYRYAKG